MGSVTGASVVRGLGFTEVLPGWPLADRPEGQVELRYDYAPGLVPEGPMEGGMWRYRALLPLDDGPVRYPLAVGGTPLVASPGLRRASGLARLYLKDETRGPSGSNKDRATALVLEQALRTGVGTVSCASTGNVAASLALGAAAAGLRAVVFVPADVDAAKLRLMRAAGARVLLVAEGYEAAFRLSIAAARRFGWLDRNTGVNPVTLEGKKTVAFEIWEQLGRRAPDAVLAPVGDGPTLSALAKGFRELVLCGVLRRMPRIIGVQAEGCQPLKRAFERGEALEPVVPRTIADGIAVGDPVSAPAVLRDVRETGGAFVAVADEELEGAISTLARSGGLVAEPAGAAAFAGLAEARRRDLLDPDECVVALVTGSGLKTPQFLRASSPVQTVAATLDAVEQALLAEPPE
jgi:threonine synthase